MRKIYYFPNLGKQFATLLSIAVLLMFSISAKGQCPVTANFIYSASNCTEVTFASLASSTPPGVIVSHRWEFGDGNVSIAEDPIHDYGVVGIYQVLYIVEDISGCYDTAEQTVAISGAPQATFTSSFSSCRFLAVNNPFADPTYTYFWDYGDGTTSTAHTPWDHEYASVAIETTYTVSFTVYNDNGCSTTATEDIVIYPDITAAFTFNPDNSCSSIPVAFDASTSVGAQSYSWSFGDGTAVQTTSNATIDHTYNSYNDAVCSADDAFTAILITTNDNLCQATTDDIVTTLKRPQPLLQDLDLLNPWSNCNNSPTPSNPDYTLTVDNITEHMICVTTLDIDWGDGNSDIGLTDVDFPLSHTYTTIDAFSLVVTAHGTNGCSGDTTYLVANQSIPNSVGINTGASTIGCAPQEFWFELTGYTGNSSGTTYTWNFGDGSAPVVWDQDHPVSVSDTAWHTYDTSACAITGYPDYDVTVTVSNLCMTRSTSVNGIFVHSQPNLSYELPNDTVCLNEETCIINTSDPGWSGYASCFSDANYTWDFGDGTTVASNTGDTVCHIWTIPDTYTVSLTGSLATSSCGDADTSFQVTVTGTHAGFTFDTACFNMPTHFTDLSYCYSDPSYLPDPNIPVNSWLWDFGDPTSGSNTSILQNPTHTYTAPGYYEVTLTVSGVFSCDPPLRIRFM